MLTSYSLTYSHTIQTNTEPKFTEEKRVKDGDKHDRDWITLKIEKGKDEKMNFKYFKTH